MAGHLRRTVPSASAGSRLRRSEALRVGGRCLATSQSPAPECVRCGDAYLRGRGGFPVGDLGSGGGGDRTVGLRGGEVGVLLQGDLAETGHHTVAVAKYGTGAVGGTDNARGTIRAVARHAGVSVSTVSNVLNNPAVVAAETRRRVEAAMAATGYVRNAQARQLRGMPSPIVGVVILDLANPFYGELARGVEDALDRSGCQLLMTSTDASPDRESRQLRTMEEQGLRGVLLTPVATTSADVREMARHGTRVVLVDHPGGPGMCSVTTDNVLGARLAVDHLLALGHRRIAFLKGSSKVRSALDRRLGVVQSLTAAGLDPAAALIEVRLPASGGATAADEAVEAILGHRDPPTAVFCLNDIAALGAIRGLRRRGLRVPADISVVGFDDVHFADVLDPGLTTVHQPSYDLGRTAAGLLLDESRGRHVHQQVVFRPSLVVRESTAPPPRQG